MKVTLPHQDDAGRKRRDYRADDFRPWLLKRFGKHAYAELERCGAREGDLETVIREVDVVRRVELPDREDDIDRFCENLVTVEVENSDRFRIRGESARAHAHDETALRQMVEHRSIHRDHHRMHLGEIGG